MRAEDSEFVLDASVAAAWFLSETGSAAALTLLQAGPCRFHVPSVWLAEIANVFVVHERRGVCQPADTARWLTKLAGLELHRDSEGASFAGIERVLFVARASGIRTYDAQYLELAMRLQLPLATLDQRLAAAAKAAGVASPLI